MDDPRPEKVGVVSEVRNRLDQASAAILTEYRGLTVKDLATLRRSLRDVGGEYRIYKNTLVRFAVRDLGLDELVPLLEGPTAIAFIDGDAVPVAKALRDFARTNTHLVVKGGVLGTKVISSADTSALADLPPRDVVLARLAGALAAPIQQFAGLLQALPRNFAYGLKALIDMGGAPGSPAAAAPEPEPAAAAPEPEPAAAAPEPEPAAAAEPESPSAPNPPVS
jgi:large subunit ribosomal protein L10